MITLFLGLLFVTLIGVFIHESLQERYKEQITSCANLNGKILKINNQQVCLDTEKDVLLVMP